MYRLDRQEFLRFPLINLWALLGFQAGFINAFGFLACGRFVSHVTGFGSQTGVALAGQSWLIALELVGFPLAFIFGAFVSGFLTIARIEQKLKPRYDIVTTILPVGLGAMLLLSLSGVLGEFGDHAGALGNTFPDFVMLYGLSFLCGMQNGCFATMTKGQIRTTHLTGISTDIGTDLAKLIFGKLNRLEVELVKRANYSRVATFVAFTIGSIVSVFTTAKFHFMALAVPMISATIVWFIVRSVSSALDKMYGSEVVKHATFNKAQQAVS